jgi:hypothetical protein
VIRAMPALMSPPAVGGTLAAIANDDQIDYEARDQLAASAGPARAAGLQVEFGGIS